MRKANITLAIAAVLILSGFTYLAIYSGVASQKLRMKTIKLQSTEQKLNSINIQYQKLDTQLKTQKTTDQKTIDQQKAQMEQLQKEKQDLEQKAQARAAEKQRLASLATSAANAATATQNAEAASAPAYSGSHEDWMAAAGIAPSDYAAVNYIVMNESGWNPSAVNRSSGACGLGQQLPCGKWAGAWNDPIAALVAMRGYAIARYGSWWGAYRFWQNNHWW